MNLADETSFRSAFGTFWLVNFFVRIYFQAKAQNPQKSFTRHEKQARLSFQILAIAYLVMIIYPLSDLLDFAHVDLPSTIRWAVGGPALLFYLFLFGWAHIALGRHWSGLPEIHEDHILVTAGPYRLMRHPMYSAFFLSGIGFFLLSANWFVAAVYLLAVAYMYFNRVAAEEGMMIERFGDPYKEYMIRTGRVLPRLPVRRSHS
jgi:protein-S-isoprenylcysteine O-methyltransferase Ste14